MCLFLTLLCFHEITQEDSLVLFRLLAIRCFGKLLGNQARVRPKQKN